MCTLSSLLDNVMDNVSNNVIHNVTSSSRYIYYNPALKMEHIGTLPETNDILSPTIIPLFGILSPPAEEECHFCMEKITKEQFLVFKLPCCGHYSHTECFKTLASLSHKESTVRCATVEQYTHTKMCASSVCKNTPKNSIVRRAVTQKFTQNAQQTSQCYSRS